MDGPGPVVLFGSGETSPSGRRVYEWVFSRYPSPVRVSILETPAGFQPNSRVVAEKIGQFLLERLPNHWPEVAVVPARARFSKLSPDDPSILSPVLRSHVVFAGPGSPTYAARQLDESLAIQYIQATQRRGASLVLASAATIAAGANCLPVYEIYKSGEDLHWRRGLDLFRPFGLSLTFIPHWNNTEGGAELDTSRCFMGRDRFERLMAMLPYDSVVVGIDEQTALVMDIADGLCRVMGRGAAILVRERSEERYDSGVTFPIGRLGAFHLPDQRQGVSDKVWDALDSAHASSREDDLPPAEVLEMVRAREEARAGKNWQEADRLRDQISTAGWRVSDTPEGPVVEPVRRAVGGG